MKIHRSSRLAIWLTPVLLSIACTFSLLDFGGPTPTPFSTPVPTLELVLITPIPVAETTFRVIVPDNTPVDEPIQLSILDEVTGLALNPQRFTMEAEDDFTYTLSLPIPDGTIIKYRYSRKGELTAEEHISDGRPVRYRMHKVNGPGVVQDIVTRWNDTLYEGPTGRISGVITDNDTGEPVPGILVIAGGAQAITSFDGSYLIESLPPGLHNVVVYAMDGTYHTYQQGAIVAEEATTPADIAVSKAPQVEVVFQVEVPEDTIPAVPVRIAGNLYQLGNVFADLSGGISTPALRLPTLTHQGGHQYQTSLFLPAGADIRYKYTLGDGLWNAEQDDEGQMRIRQLIVPEEKMVLKDQVESWKSRKSAPIWFEVNTPEETPADNLITIQFNPFGWTQPIPMWRVEENRWVYLLTNPLDFIGRIGYRYCRNGQCGIADDAITGDPNASGRPVSTSLLFQNIQDDVEEWKWLEPFPETVPVSSESIIPRDPSFMAGIELQADYHPSWLPLMPRALHDVQSAEANWVIIDPTWSFTSAMPPVFQAVTGRDPLWNDMVQIIEEARTRELNVALYPHPRLPVEPDTWWEDAPRDFAWWTVWFERYRTFALHHAGLAAKTDVQTLILGGDWLNPALPDGFLVDGFSSEVPSDAEERWRAMIASVRQVFPGTIAWALPYPSGVQNPPPFLDAVDQIYILWSAPLSQDPNSPSQALEEQAGQIFDNFLLPFSLQVEKPLILAAAYPSADGGITGCIPASNEAEDCLDFDALSRPASDIPSVSYDPQEQIEVYNALLSAVNDRDWIAGFTSQGYYPPARLQDKSISVHGKPAEEVLEHWFRNFKNP